MPLMDRPDDVRDFLGGGNTKPQAKKKKVIGEKAYLLYLPAEDMARVKIAAARRGMTMKEFFADIVRKACEGEK